MTSPIGQQLWIIPDGYIPVTSHGPAPDMTSHDAFCVLNTGLEPAQLVVTIYFENSDPIGPFHLQIAARRTRHFKFNDLRDPAPIPRGIPYACTIESDRPIVVQHTRLDTRQAELALMSTIAYAPAG